MKKRASALALAVVALASIQGRGASGEWTAEGVGTVAVIVEKTARSRDGRQMLVAVAAYPGTARAGGELSTSTDPAATLVVCRRACSVRTVLVSSLSSDPVGDVRLIASDPKLGRIELTWKDAGEGSVPTAGTSQGCGGGAFGNSVKPRITLGVGYSFATMARRTLVTGHIGAWWVDPPTTFFGLDPIDCSYALTGAFGLQIRWTERS
jgi:hypothetical protein